MRGPTPSRSRCLVFALPNADIVGAFSISALNVIISLARRDDDRELYVPSEDEASLEILEIGKSNFIALTVAISCSASSTVSRVAVTASV